MSTKTTIKRIALVAVSALGLGVVTTIAPANAVAGLTASSIVVGDLPPVRVGVTSYVPVKVYLPSTAAANDTITITAQISSAPLMGGAANAASILSSSNATAGNDGGEVLSLTDTLGTVSSVAGATEVEGRLNSAGTDIGDYDSTNYPGNAAAVAPGYAVSAAEVTAGYVQLYVSIKPDVAGSYRVLVSSSATDTNGGYAAGDASASFTVTTGSSVSTVEFTNTYGGIIAGANSGALVKVTLKDASGNLAALSGNETLNVTTSGSGAVNVGHTGTSYTTTSDTISASEVTNGVVWVQVRNTGTAAETISLTITGSGDLSASVTATKTFSVLDDAGSSTAMTFESPSTTADYAMTNATISSDTISVTELSASQKLGFTFSDYDATVNGYVTVTDSAGKITGKSSAVYTQVYSIADGDEGLSLSYSAASAVATGTLFTVAIPAAASTTAGLSSARTITFASVARSNSTFTVTPNSTFLAAPGAAIALTATLKDQFGAARAGQTVTITTSGRNNPVATTAVTDASGKVSFTTADASTSTTNLIDTVSFAATNATTKNVTINYANTSVGTVTVTGGNTTASVTAATNSVKPISAGDGAEAGAIDVVATVKDANGNALAGVAVNFTVAGSGVAFKSTSATKYTDSEGKATGSLYAWTAGTYTYTVTAGGKTTTGTATFGSTTASNARVVSATASGNVVIGKVVDRFGNPVQGVTLYASTSAPSNIGGVFYKDVATDANGEAKWVITGSGTVTVSAVSPTAVAGTTFGQTCALAGNLTCAVPGTAAEAFTASTAGTATTAETYVGASIAPAGVASATVEVTDATTSDSIDAANEATDAANAATDAANAAAEAADAATAAAQDAQAAVAELATKVASLIAGIKAQITTLTNLVIKIQKKVRA